MYARPILGAALLLSAGCGGAAAETASREPKASSRAASVEGASPKEDLAPSASSSPTMPATTTPPPEAPSGLLSLPDISTAAGGCTGSTPVVLWTSDLVGQSTGPWVGVAATTQGVLAAWTRPDGSILVSQLDRRGALAGEPTPIILSSQGVDLVPMHDGSFLLYQVWDSTFAMRVDVRASSKEKDPRVSFPFKVQKAIPTDKGVIALVRLRSYDEYGVATISPGDKPAAEVKALAKGLKQPKLVADRSGRHRVVSMSADDRGVIVSEDGTSTDLVLPKCDHYTSSPDVEIDGDGTTLLRTCDKLYRVENGKLELRPKGGREIHFFPRWDIETELSSVDGSHVGISFVARVVGAGRQHKVSLLRETRPEFRSDLAWTGEAFVALYGRRKIGGKWEVVSTAITCDAQ